MATFTEENVELILAACSGDLTAAAQSLGQCFGRSCRMEAGASGVWSPADVAAAFRGPGWLTLCQVESQALAVLIPESLTPAEWTQSHGDDAQSRLATLASELPINLLPPDFAIQRSAAFAVPDLSAALGPMAPAEWAATIELLVFDSDSANADSTSDREPEKLLVVWPLQKPIFSPTISEKPSAGPAQMQPPSGDQVPATSAPKTTGPLSWLRHLPVQVSVRLAEKRIPMSQLMNISPGMLIPFNKSCEDLLDLYVNNSRYCRGEAVKIGENFGLKIDEVGVKSETQRKVIEA
jgi:flagellar motor switch protein FliN